MTSMTSDPHLNTGALALDAMPDDEASDATAHIEECESCAAELAGFLETAALLGSVAAEVPPASLRRAVMAGIAITPQLPPIVGHPERRAPRHAQPDDASEPSGEQPTAPTSGVPGPPASQGSGGALTEGGTQSTGGALTEGGTQTEGGALTDGDDRHQGPQAGNVVPIRRWYRRPGALIAAAVAAVVIGGGAVIAVNRTSAPPDQQVALHECVDQAGDAQVLKPADGGGEVTFAPSCDAALVDVSGLRDLPADRTYQLWVLAGSSARSVTLLSQAAAGQQQIWMAPTQAGDTAIGITEEPAAGSPQPTSAPIWAVSLPA